MVGASASNPFFVDDKHSSHIKRISSRPIYCYVVNDGPAPGGSR